MTFSWLCLWQGASVSIPLQPDSIQWCVDKQAKIYLTQNSSLQDPLQLCVGPERLAWLGCGLRGQRWSGMPPKEAGKVRETVFCDPTAVTVPFPTKPRTVSDPPLPSFVPNTFIFLSSVGIFVFLSLWRKTSRGSERNVTASNSWRALLQASIQRLDFIRLSFSLIHPNHYSPKRPFSLGLKTLHVHSEARRGTGREAVNKIDWLPAQWAH